MQSTLNSLSGEVATTSALDLLAMASAKMKTELKSLKRAKRDELDQLASLSVSKQEFDSWKRESATRVEFDQRQSSYSHANQTVMEQYLKAQSLARSRKTRVYGKTRK
jgi:hypothetical protein